MSTGSAFSITLVTAEDKKRTLLICLYKSFLQVEGGEDGEVIHKFLFPLLNVLSLLFWLGYDFSQWYLVWLWACSIDHEEKDPHSEWRPLASTTLDAFFLPNFALKSDLHFSLGKIPNQNSY